MSAPVLRAENVAKIYRSGGTDLVVFSGVDFSVARGELVAIVGESGSGKTTLLHLLGGLDPPSQGRILYEERDIAALDDAGRAQFRNQTVGYVWQVHYLLPEFTAQENVMMPLLIRGEAHHKAAAEALERLEEVGLKARASHRAGELSGGEQQRVALARALAARPAILLADEPTGNLDYKTGEMIFSLIAGLHRTHQLASVFVTHNMSFARRCDRILRMEAGGLEDTGTAGIA